jgi:pyridoxamine 5'-phosphate oxidase
MPAGGGEGMPQGHVKRFIYQSIERSAEHHDIGADEHPRRLGDKIRSNDFTIWNVSAFRLLDKQRHRFQADVMLQPNATLQKIIRQIRPPAAHIQHGRIGEIEKPSKRIEPSGLCAGAGPKQRPESAGMLLCRGQIRDQICRSLSTHAGIVGYSSAAVIVHTIDAMVQWMHDLQVLLDAEFIKRPIVASLATVDADGKPHVRMMVIRRVDERELCIWMTTDARSGKVAELKNQPTAELLIWAASERQQFRLRGSMRIHTGGAIRQAIWEQLRGDTRATFSWPAPELPRNAADEFVSSVAANVPPPKNFLALCLHPDEVESLELNERPHCRRRWRAADGWKVTDINP